MMTRKHFIRLAEILKQYEPEPKLVQEIANFCASENHLFDRYKFYEKSGMYERLTKADNCDTIEVIEP